LLGLAGAGTGAALGSAATHDAKTPRPTPDEKCSEDAGFFREVLKEGRSLIVVRTESKDLATLVCSVLDRLGLGMQNRTPVKMQIITRVVDNIAVLDVSGLWARAISCSATSFATWRTRGSKKIVLNLGEVQYVDSSGIGELVKAHTTIRNQGGHLRLVNLNKRVSDLLQLTKLSAVFDIEKDEASAISSLKGDAIPRAVA
jgi:anti-sigma B factor antagonist